MRKTQSSFAFVLASLSASLLGGCSVQTTTERPIPEGMTPACRGGALSLAAGLRPAQPVDFVGFRAENTTPDPPEAGGATKTTKWSATITSDSVGSPCRGARDVATCLSEMDARRALGDACNGIAIRSDRVQLQESRSSDVAAPGASAPPTPGTCGVTALVYTRGDEVGLVQTLDEARAFLGVIDSPEEALLLVRLSGEALTCADAAPAAYRQLADGSYEVQASYVTRCGDVATRKVLRVTPGGQISVVSSINYPVRCY